MRERPREESTLPRFGLGRAGEDLELHALAPGTDAGAALCGAVPPTGGWVDVDQTTWLYLIDCHTCRERAAALLSAHASASEEAGNG